LPDGARILIAAFAAGGRGTTGFVDPDGSHLRKVPLPPGTLNLVCTQGFSPATRRLACEGWSETDPGLQGIYTVRASDGGDLLRVTRCSQDCRVIGFSPDGSRIFFFQAVAGFHRSAISSRVRCSSSARRGTDVHRITHADTPVEVAGNPGGRLTPDGGRIVFTSSGAIWTVHPDGTALRKVYQDAQDRLAITPTWSPDGRFILFGLDPPGSLATVDLAPANGLYVVQADGTHLTPLIVSDDWKRNPDWVAGR
jgi:TolB protein